MVALGGNALIRPGEAGTIAEQVARVAEVAKVLAALQPPGGLVLTHGNGPQVGRHLLRNDHTRGEVPPSPLDIAVAATQGEIGFLLQSGLRNALDRRGDDRPVVALLTQVVVDIADPAFLDPTKFVGRFYSEAEAKARAAALGWQVKPDSDRGWRRVVASPEPLEIIELESIDALCRAGSIVIAVGGGGVPVARTPIGLTGVEAVVDKDRASCLLAHQLQAARLVILTGVRQVQVDFGTPRARVIDVATATEMAAWLAEGQFPAGSMGPKVRAALTFLQQGGDEVVVTTPEDLEGAMAGGPCTRITAR